MRGFVQFVQFVRYGVRWLFDLIGKFERVVWVGGMAHWTRLRSRLEQS
jgi:hypothetical protein